MFNHFNRTIACLAVVTLAAHITASGQDYGTKSLASLLNLEFKGGTAAEFVDAIRRSASETNLVVLADLTKVNMPAVTLKSVDPGTALDLLESLPRQQGGDTLIAIEVHQDGASVSGKSLMGQWPVFTITAETAASRRSENRDSLVLQVGEILDEQVKAADMLTAIEAALSMLEPEFPAAQIKFHEATALLIARGHPDQMGCVQRVVQQLQERKAISEQSLRKQLQNLQNAAAESESQKAALADLRMQIELRESKLQMLHQELDRAAQRAEKANGERDEMARRMHQMELDMQKGKGG